MFVVASTLSGPADGTTGAISSSGTFPVRLRGSIVAARFGAPACAGPIASDGSNVVSDTTCGSAAPGDRTGSDPLLLPLGPNGGPTATRQPYASSPAVNAIPLGTAGLCDGALATDQRGSIRPVGGACDAGAVEGPSSITPSAPLSLTVTSGADAPDAVPGNGICASTSGPCTLRAAIDESNAWPRIDTITVAAGVTTTLSLPGAGEDANATGDLDIVDPVTISGNGTTIDAANLDRAIDRRSGTTTISNITVRGAIDDGTGRSGAVAVQDTSGPFTISGSTITANATSGIWTKGAINVRTSSITGNTSAGIRSDGLQPGVVDQTTISGNGAGIATYGPMAIRRSTIVGNSGPAVAQESYWEDITITASTISGNSSAPAILTLASGGSWVKVTGSAITNTPGNACRGTIQSGGFNRVTDASCGLAGTGDAQVANLALGALAANGGPTLTRLPNAGSTLLDVIPAGTIGLCDASLPVDQRGQIRPKGTGCDVGAVERTP
jgi:CSLREA domain-containing protein